MTEGSFQAFFVLTLVATALSILRPTSGRAAVAGVLAAMTILIRPQRYVPHTAHAAGHRVGWPQTWMAETALGHDCDYHWPRSYCSAGGQRATPQFMVSSVLSNVGPLVNFGVSARWVELESPALAEDKALIADSIRRYRSMPDDFNWVVWAPEGPVLDPGSQVWEWMSPAGTKSLMRSRAKQFFTIR